MEFALISDWKRHPCREAQLEEIYAKEFSRRGHKIHWLAFIPGLAAEKKENWHGQPLTLLPRGRGMLRGLSRWLTPLLAGKTLDFVQVRNDPVFAILARLYARRAGVPFVYHLSTLNGPGLLDEARLDPFPRSWLTSLKGRLGGALVDRVASACDLLIPISAGMGERARAHGRRGPIAPLPMGCADPRPSPPPPPRATVEFLYIGAMDPLRRLDFLLNAFARAQAKDARLRLTMLGDSRRPGGVESLQALARTLGITQFVRFEPAVPREQVAARIDACDIGVSPIPPTEYFRVSSPTKLMECLGRGRPVVANDLPEQKQVLEESGGGLCVRYDENAFADALLALAADPKRREEAGRCGFDYVKKHRDYRVLAATLEQDYRRHVLK